LVDAVHKLAESRPQPTEGTTTADEEILRLFVPGGDPQCRGIVAARFGLNGQVRSSLDSIRRKFKVTPQRIVQLCSLSPVAMRMSPPPAPSLDSVLEAVGKRLSAPAQIIESELVSAGLLEKGTRIENIIEVAKLLNRAPAFMVSYDPARRVDAELRTVSQLRKIATLTARRVAKFGAATMDDIRRTGARLSRGSLSAAVIDTVVKSCAGFRWLDEEAGYFWLDNGRPNMLGRRIEHVLSVAPRIGAAELRAAIRRDHRYAGPVPPTRVLLELCRRLPECRVDGNDIVAVNPVDPLDLLHGDEATVIGLLLEHGSVCQREHLQKLALEAGVGASSFGRCLSFCSTITRYARGVFGLTGAKVLPGQIESLTLAIPRGDVLQDHGWTEAGNVWIACRLSQNSIETGVIGVPAAQREYIQGKHALRTTAGAAAGKLVAKDSFARGLKSCLRKSGAEGGDILVLEISQKERAAFARVGDDSLWEEFAGD